MPSLATLGRTIQQHPWSTTFDVSLLVALMTGSFLLALQYDVIEYWDRGMPGERRVSIEEALALSGLLGFGVTAFVWRRTREEQLDRERWKSAQAELREHRLLAMLDPLTALPNRREFMRALDAAVASPQRELCAVYLLDLNGFKAVNDRHGHAVGDELLRAVAQRFRSEARDEDVLARLGGDEFAVLARNVVDRDGASEVGQRFIDALANSLYVSGRPYSVGVSVGVALLPADGKSTYEVMHQADIAMYKAKAAKGSALRFFDSSEQPVILGRTA